MGLRRWASRLMLGTYLFFIDGMVADEGVVGLK
jgi:hypothetical protein